MIQLAVVYHSGQGHTEVVAQAVVHGAREVKNTRVTLYTVNQAIEKLDELDQADAMIFGSPTYMGSVSAEFKTFMEASSSKYFERAWQDKVAAGFTNSSGPSGDKLNTLVDFVIFAAQQGMHWVNLGLLGGCATSGDDFSAPETLNRLGSYLGVQTFSYFDKSAAEQAPPENDKATARYLGHRVAEVTHQLRLGRDAWTTQV